MTIGDLIKNKDYDYISYRLTLPNGSDTFAGCFASKDGEIISLDGDIYNKDEEVLANRDTILCELGNVVLQGIDRSVSMDNEDTSEEIKDLYKERFIQAVVDYKKYRNEEVKKNVQEESEMVID